MNTLINTASKMLDEDCSSEKYTLQAALKIYIE